MQTSKVDKITVVTEIGIVVALGEKWGTVTESGRGRFGVLAAFFFLNWVVVTWVVSYCEKVLHCTLMVRELLNMYDRLQFF